MEDSVLWFCILTLQLGFAMKLTFLAVSLISERSSGSIRANCGKRYVLQLFKWWKEPLDGRSEQELDQTRCSWTRLVWRLVAAIAMFRLIIRQVRLWEDTQVGSQWDWSIVTQATFALLLTSFPTLINPRCQDPWYMVVMVTLDASILIQAQIGGSDSIDVRDVITYLWPGRFIYAVLAKRTCCVVFCSMLHLLQAIYIVKSQGDVAGTAYSSQAVVTLFLLMLCSIICVRRLLAENSKLKVGLRERTVELGAVSSLLTACYDAVLEVDDQLRLTHDSRQLSSMLLCAPRPGGLCGEALLAFFCGRDQTRISEILNGEGRSVVALNADMLDSDHNQVKVELFSVQFKNLANETCFLVALREIQHTELCATEAGPGSGPVPQVPSQSSDVSVSNQDLKIARDETLLVVFDLYTFEVYNMSGDMQQLCEQCLGLPIPDDVLDVASHDTRLSLSSQLQIVGNSFAARHVDTTVAQVEDLQSHPMSHPCCVSFNFLELWEAKGSLTIDHDQVLDSWVGSMVIQRGPAPIPPTLTLKNLQDLDQNLPRDRPQSHSLDSARHGLGNRSSRSSRSSPRSRSSRHSRPSRPSVRISRPNPSNERGGIRELHSVIRL